CGRREGRWRFGGIALYLHRGRLHVVFAALRRQATGPVDQERDLLFVLIIGGLCIAEERLRSGKDCLFSCLGLLRRGGLWRFVVKLLFWLKKGILLCASGHLDGILQK